MNPTITNQTLTTEVVNSTNSNNNGYNYNTETKSYSNSYKKLS